MICKLKNLGIAFAATIALSAMLVSMAHAGKLDIATNPAAIKGHTTEGIFQFSFAKTAGGQATGACVTASFEGTVQQGEGATQEINEATITPTFGFSQTTPTFCGLPGSGEEAHVVMNGCKFTLTGSEQEANTYLVDIVGCTAGKQMQMKDAACTIDIPEQNGLSHLVVSNLESGKVKFDLTLANITNTQTGAGCIDGNNHQSTNLSFKVKTTVEAFRDEGTQQVTKHGHQYTEHFASTPGFNVEAQPAVLTGSNETGQQHKLAIKSTSGSSESAFQCASASFEGTTSTLQTQALLVTPTYTSCVYQVFLAATVQMNGCKYTITSANPEYPINTATVDIVACTPGKSITYQSIACQVVIPEQSGLSHVVSTNPGGTPHTTTLAFTLTGLTNTQFGSCPDGTNHHGTGASLTANMTVRAYKDQGSEQVTAHGHQYNRLKEGTQVGLTYPKTPTQVSISST